MNVDATHPTHFVSRREIGTFSVLPTGMKDIPAGRKKLHYLGTGLAALGALIFLSVFVSGALHFGDFSNFQERSQSEAMRGFIGMALIITGLGLRMVALRGVAGSGLILDPKKAADDLEPWARMGGGLAKHALDEAGIKQLGGAQMPFDEKLRRLEALKKEGLLSDAEYQAKRKEVLSEKL